jgi:putative hydrolase of the HAD superfamily
VRPKAVLLDALGTLLELPDPRPALVAGLARRGVTVTPEEAGTALRAEIAYYRAHHDEAGDAAALAVLRAECTAVLRGALPARARDAPDLQGALLDSLRFRAFPEVPGVLRALRAAGARLVVLSNWDVSLHEALAATGLAPLVDGAVSSAEAGAAKPDPRAFAAALALAGAGPDEAVHVGDSPEFDVAGARAAGLPAVLVVRDGPLPPAEPGVTAIRSLSELPGLHG